MGFTFDSWPVVGKAVGTYLAEVGGFSQDAYLELLLKIKDGDPEALGAVIPFLYAEFTNLLQKDERELRPEEAAFLQDFLDSMNEQRSNSATAAWYRYEQWRSEQYG